MYSGQLETLLQTADKEIVKRRKRIKTGLITVLSVTFTWLIFCMLLMCFLGINMVAFIGLIGIFPVIMAGFFIQSKEFLRAAAELARYDDVSAVPALSEAALTALPETRLDMEDALVHLLCLVKEADWPLFTKEVFRTQKFLFFRSKKLTLAFLQAYTQVGGANELRLVKYHIRAGRLARDPDLQQAAENCLKAIQTRLAQDSTSDYLLRASEGMLSEELLRAAGSHSANSGILLRQADNPGTDTAHSPIQPIPQLQENKQES